MPRPLIAVDVHAVGEKQTGNETYVRNLLDQFLGMDLPWALRLYHTGSGEDVRAHWPDASLRRLWPRSPLLRIPISTPLVLAMDRVDLAHFQYVAPPVCPCPTVVTVHDISYEFFPEYFHPLQRAQMKFAIPLSARRAAQVVTISEYSRKTIVERYGIPEEKVTVTYLGVSPAFRRITPEEALEATGRFAISRPFILAVGNLQPRKNLERLIEAYAILRERTGADHELVLVGKLSWKGHRIQERAERLRVSDHVHLVGYVSEEELVALYNRATVFAYPSTFEGFGLPVLEAMGCGTPVLTSNVSSLPEVAGDAAVQVDPLDVDAIASGLQGLIESATLRAELSGKGLRRAREFGWERTAVETLRVYEKVLAMR